MCYYDEDMNIWRCKYSRNKELLTTRATNESDMKHLADIAETYYLGQTHKRGFRGVWGTEY